MKKFSSMIKILFVLFLITTSLANAQAPNELELTLSRDFGYGGFNNDIQGLFTMKIKNPPANLAMVDFLIDSTSMGEVTQSPFSLSFNTDSYPLGVHSLSAIGYTTDGNQLNSNIIQVNFVPAGSGMEAVVKIIVPVVLLIVLIGLISVFLPLILSKGKIASTPLGMPRKYGIGGGAICPKCSRPFRFDYGGSILVLKKLTGALTAENGLMSAVVHYLNCRPQKLLNWLRHCQKIRLLVKPKLIN